MTRFLLFSALILGLSTSAQHLKSPSEFLGYELGTAFSRHYEVVDYFEYLAQAAPDRVKLKVYGQTNERRPLILVYVSSPGNIAQLETIREEHLKATKGEGTGEKAIVWLSYNVHGNESVSTEASMKTIYELLTTRSSLLENTLVIMDPCVNPDGRDRYSNWYNQYQNRPHQVDPNSKEHHEGWWNGRSNHYMFDLNRDWAWLTQIESQQRIEQYNDWLPHVHVDFHEQGVDNPYYFAPAAEPYHEVITDFQREFQTTLGRNHAKYFDAQGWFYFTKEVFDLFYPSYGDTYPIYNGAIGMTYEQGGSGRAGLGIVTRIGDTLTLKDRIDHHFTTGISTVEVSSQNALRLNQEFRKFYQKKDFRYKSYVLKGNRDKLEGLKSLLDKHRITYGDLGRGTYKGHDFKTGTHGSLSVEDNAMVVSTDQPKGTLVQVLFEPNAKLSDSLTYDITAWSLPYAHGLETLASTTLIAPQAGRPAPPRSVIDPDSYGHITDWNSLRDARFLAELIQNGVRARTADHPFSIAGRSFERGSLIITKGDNVRKSDFIQVLQGIADRYEKEVFSTGTGFVDTGKDFGSSSVRMIRVPKIAVLSGGPTSSLRFGEIWHFFEQQLNYPLTVIDDAYAGRVDLDPYNILILPDGRYGDHFTGKELSKLKDWVAKGGKLIAMGGAIKALDGKDGFGIKQRELEEDQEQDGEPQVPQSYEDLEREQIKGSITGAIFKAQVDNTHPLAYGYGPEYFSLKLGSDSYEYLDSGNAVYLVEETVPYSGFAGSDAQKEIDESLIYGVETHGRGQVIYMVDNPLFRGFWENGKLLFANALFMVD